MSTIIFSTAPRNIKRVNRSLGIGSTHLPLDDRSSEILSMIRRLQPQILINDRANIPADFGTPEQYIPATGIVSPDGSQQLWESCLTMTSYRWGYHWHKEEYKSEKDLIRTLIDVVSKGGNLLLNIGPRLFAIYALNS